MAKVLLCLAILPLLSQASVNFDQCLANIKKDHSSRLSQLCRILRGGQEPFQWSTFSQEFGSWLLPWLALISQLPFGTNDKLINLESMWLDYTYTWSISAATSIAWVVIAYVFTVIDSFTGDITATFQSTISPKCDSDRLRKAVQKANGIAYMAKDSGDIVLASTVSDERAIFLDFNDHDTLRIDEKCTAPIFNYARFLPWVQAVETISDAYSGACNNVQQHRPVNRLADWVEMEKGKTLYEENRVGNSTEVADYCEMLSLEKGGAVLIAWYTPTRGLGCRSSSYVAYGALSTISWLLLVISSIFSHCSTTSSTGHHQNPRGAFRTFSILLRRIGKLIASMNAIWIVVSCLFQFTNFFDSAGYNVILPGQTDLLIMRGGWTSGVALAGGTAFIFVVFVNLLINPTLPE
ncbi:hypothetical protein BDQ17DRAFT_1365030 [Cyathus striatus]|nr:hypothetical protein BDQ17DRAFT_1365030 [Cyathus striatus]